MLLYIGLLGLWVSGIIVPARIWWGILLLPAISLILQFKTTRVFYIRLHDLANWALGATDAWPVDLGSSWHR